MSPTVLRLAQILADWIAIEVAIDGARHRIDTLAAGSDRSDAWGEFEHRMEDALTPEFELLAAMNLQPANDNHWD